MSNASFELVQSAVGLEVASNAAMTSLGLAPGEFAWFSGETLHPMEPQTLLPESDIEVDYVKSRVTLYGGRAANSEGNFGFGHIQADVEESIPEGAKHQAGRHQTPMPFIPRLLTLKDGVITVDTPTVHAPLSEGPVVIEGDGRNPRFRKMTNFYTETGAITVKSGQLITDGHGWSDDKTVEHDAFELPDDILLPRLATVLRTIKTVSAMFDQIAWRNARNVRWEITENSRF